MRHRVLLDPLRKLARTPLSSASALLSPVAAWGLFGLGATRRHLAREWLFLWTGFAVPLLLVDTIGGRWGSLAIDLGQAAIGVVTAWVFVTKPKPLRSGLLAALILLVALCLIEGFAYRQVWKSPGQSPRASVEASLLWGVDRVSEPGTYRLWRRASPSGAIAIALEARATELGTAVDMVSASVAIDRLDSDTALGGDRRHFEVSDSWRDFAFTLTNEELAELRSIRTTLHIAAGAEVEVRNFRLNEAGGGERIAPVNPLPRQQLWYGHPNLLAHAAAMGGVAFAVLPGSLLASGAGLAGAISVALLAGSRAAVASIVLAASGILIIGVRARRKVRWKIAGMVVALGMMVVVGYVLLEGEDRVQQGQAPRSLIASTAIDAIRAAPWQGLGPEPDEFAMFWQSRNAAEYAPVSHAHNWWLHNGVTHGVPGLIAAVWLTMWLTIIAWRSGRFRGLLLVACLGLLQVVDSTLFSWGVALPLILIVNAHGRPMEAPA